MEWRVGFEERLREAAGNRDLLEVCKEAGVDIRRLMPFLNRIPNTFLAPGDVESLARALGVHPLWLKQGAAGKASKEPGEPADAETVMLTFLAQSERSIERPFPLRAVDAVSLGFPRARLHAMRVVGDAMEPRLRDGDVAIVELSTEPHDGILLLQHGNFLRLREAQVMNDGSLRLTCTNARYAPEVWTPGGDEQIVGRVRRRALGDV